MVRIEMKKMKMSIAVAALVVGAVALPAGVAGAAELGGWDENTGWFSTSSGPEIGGRSAAVTAVNHRGASEEKVVNGYTNKRAKGWTTWVGVRHYTTARMESGSTVLTSSGRQWGTSGTQATSPWFVANHTYGKGSAKSYYGR
ncbi:hypothetical protein ASF82_11845 [Frigoribacterium sp. Leaf164]|nr:hypothetical protein ASF82_11845 [Frigoribacterium sp. Leaf164]